MPKHSYVRYDPRSGKKKQTGELKKLPEMTFTLSKQGAEQNRILVFDDAVSTFEAPGKTE